MIKHPRGEAVVWVHFYLLAHLNGERQSNTKNVLIYYQLIQIFARHYTDSSMLQKLRLTYTGEFNYSIASNTHSLLRLMY